MWPVPIPSESHLPEEVPKSVNCAFNCSDPEKRNTVTSAQRDLSASACSGLPLRGVPAEGE